MTMVSCPLSWVYGAKSLPFGCSGAPCIGQHSSLLVHKADWVVLLMVRRLSLSCTWRQILSAESKFCSASSGIKQLAHVLSRCINWTVKHRDHKRLKIIAKHFHFLNFELSSCICQTLSALSSALHRRLSPFLTQL